MSEIGLQSRPLRVRLGLVLTLTGFLIFLLGAKPQWFALDRSEVVGFVQILVFLLGLALLGLGGYFAVDGLWNGDPRTLWADIGVRLISTGYLIAVFSAMADVFGFGTQTLPLEIPYFGPWQARGTLLGEMVMLMGVLLSIPWHLYRPSDDTEITKKTP